MLLGRRIQNLRKLAQFEIPKNRWKLYNNVNIAMAKNGKNGEYSGNFSKFKKLKF